MTKKNNLTIFSCFSILLILSGTIQASFAIQHTPSITHATEEKELLIIAPSIFKQSLQDLIEHKQQHGIDTFFTPLESILNHPETNMGRDDAEKMKYYIKYAIEEFNISYVLLVGGKKGQMNKWHLPVRYVDMDNDWEPHYVSDLYFADIYDENNDFSSWDSDRDGQYGEWKEGLIPEDKDIDLYPDLSLGRIPCRNRFELENMVEKIIYYETETKHHPRFHTMLLVGGDTYLASIDPLWEGYEGEEFAEEAINLMTDFTPTRMYLSEDGFSGPSDIIEEFNKGYGFVYLVGHGSPKSWGNHRPNDHNFTDGLNTNDMKKLQNNELFPVCVVSGCHNCQFDVGLNNLFLGFMEHRLGFLTDKLIFRYEWIPQGWGWMMTKQAHAGSIVTYGTSALGHTQEDKDSFRGGINEFEIALFNQYANQGIIHTGDILKNAMHWYLESYPIDWNTNNETKLLDTWVDVQVCQSYMLMGDPTLKIGGY